jgi:uncharacterized protein YkvS
MWKSEALKRRTSIMMPACNVEDGIAEAIDEVKGVVEKIADSYEIMVVNDVHLMELLGELKR